MYEHLLPQMEALNIAWSYRIHIQLKKKSPVEPTSKINIESLETESTRLLYQNRLTEKINDNNIEEGNDVDQAWKKVRTNIIDSIIEAVGIRNLNESRNNKPWFIEEIKILAGEKRETYLKCRNNKS